MRITDDLITTCNFVSNENFDVHTDVLYDLYISKKKGIENSFPCSCKTTQKQCNKRWALDFIFTV